MNVLRVTLQRLALAVPTVFVVATFTFFLVQLIPGNPAAFILGEGATIQQVHAVDANLGLNRPLLDQYASWLGNVVHGDLGMSYISNLPVTTELRLALQPTISLAVLSTLAALVFGTLLGVLAGLRTGPIDATTQVGANLGLAVPNFWVAVLLIYLFAVRLNWFPATGYTPLTSDPGRWIVGLVLPVAAVAANSVAQIFFQARTSTREVLTREFVRTLQAAGLSRRRILLKHVFRNAAIPVVTVTGFVFVVSLSGVVIIESIFNISGVGSLLLRAVTEHDLPVVQGAILYFCVAVILVNIIIDALVAWIDPRVRRA